MEQNIGEEYSIEEKATREGSRIFPDNPEGANLVTKSILGSLSEEEESELTTLIEEKQYSPSVIELFKKSEQHDPSISRVEVNHGGNIRVLSEEPAKTIWTYGLGTCNATLTFAEMTDGSRETLLTLDFPDKIQEQAEELSNLLSKVEKKNAEKIKSIIFTLGKKTEEKTELEIEKPKLALMLETIIRSQFPDSEIETIPYPKFHNRLSEKKDQGVLIANIPGKAKGDATFQTWFKNGVLS